MVPAPATAPHLGIHFLRKRARRCGMGLDRILDDEPGDQLPIADCG